MFTHKIKFRNWEFEVDFELTRKTYEKALGGNSEGCPCNYCKNYQQQKENVFPKEIKSLFGSLGIDYHKESEAYQTHKLENGLYNYGGWFHFAGNILLGEECIRENSNIFELILIEENFSIGFSKDRSLSFFEKNVPLVQVEFDVNIPWIIKETESD